MSGIYLRMYQFKEVLGHELFAFLCPQKIFFPLRQNVWILNKGGNPFCGLEEVGLS